VFEPGAATASIEIIPTGDTGVLTVTLLDGEGYDLGDPSSVTSSVTRVTNDCGPTSTTPGTTITELPRS
jgi:hypothetical protein